MPWEPIVPEGLHLGTSSEVDGAVTGHLFDESNALVGHAAWEWVDDREPDPEQSESSLDVSDVAAGLALIGLAVAASMAAPHVQKWLNNRALPAMRSTWRKLARSPRTSINEVQAIEPAMLVAVIQADSEHDLDARMPDDGTVSMSGAEAERRLVAMLTAAAFVAEQMRTLSNVRIESSDYQELKSALARLATQDVTDSVNRILAARETRLDPATSAEFTRIFGGGHTTSGDYLPVTNDTVKNALRLSND